MRTRSGKKIIEESESSEKPSKQLKEESEDLSHIESSEEESEEELSLPDDESDSAIKEKRMVRKRIARRMEVNKATSKQFSIKGLSDIAIKKIVDRVKAGITKLEESSMEISKYLKTRKLPFNFMTGKAGELPNSSRKTESKHKHNLRSSSKASKDSMSPSKRRSSQLVETVKEEDMEGATIYQPKGIKNCVLKDFQVEGLNWLIDIYNLKVSGTPF